MPGKHCSQTLLIHTPLKLAMLASSTCHLYPHQLQLPPTTSTTTSNTPTSHHLHLLHSSHHFHYSNYPLATPIIATTSMVSWGVTCGL